MLYHFFLNPLRDVTPLEPPVLKPSIPIIGHLIGLFRHHSHYLRILRDKVPSKPIVTLNLGTMKAYAVFDPQLQQYISRNKAAGSDQADAAAVLFGFDKKRVIDVIEGRDGVHAKSSSKQYMDAARAMLSGDSLRQMHERAMVYISGRLKALDKVNQADSLYDWLQDLMSVATSEAFFGEKNPYRQEGLVDDQWNFEGNMEFLALPNTVASIIARSAYHARARIHAALGRYYSAHDEEHGAAEVVRIRAVLLRQLGIADEDFAKHEMTIMHGGTTNTIPAAFWVITNIFLRPQLAEELRVEAQAFCESSLDKETGKPKPNKNKPVVSIPLHRIPYACPLLNSCFRETMRLSSQWFGWRTLTQDLELPSSITESRPYILRKGAQVLMPAGVTHRLPSVWGSNDPDVFNPRRFMNDDENNRKVSKEQKGNYLPWGGGSHLCPGRNFATGEILGLVVALVLGFHVDGLREENVRMRWARIWEAIAKPEPGADGGRVVIRRREGWEDLEWDFVY
ncbi:cytochrome P450 [Podospora didyma]|uniref:Cytochrome P450 n=1 Tax=Podospora didyma TaxID=330526 RepID=A0AAE0K097_9PEZI|nr:cytochrome P450 [Podospora didyma]